MREVKTVKQATKELQHYLGVKLVVDWTEGPSPLACIENEVTGRALVMEHGTTIEEAIIEAVKAMIRRDMMER